MATKHFDLEGVITDWAWDYFRRKATSDEKKLLDKDLVRVDIDWKRVRFTHQTPSFDPEPQKPGSGTPKNNVLFFTTFSNKTDHPQTYSFKTQRTTRSCCMVEVEHGYTKGMSMDVKLTTPGSILEANAGFHRELSLTEIEGQTIEEELTWAVDSQIEVKPGHRAEAKLIIVEEEYHGSFSLETRVKGRVRAVFTNLKDNNSFIKAVEGGIVQVVQWATREGYVDGGSVVTVDSATASAVCQTRGKCTFRYGLQQDVEVDQVPL
ncbi:hypothetical protein LSAT2_029485 [Lamellibrachia satsuma]|nr:hypothetical protein LSAT2_029485 [Lamellibrachia satsuma]